MAGTLEPYGRGSASHLPRVHESSEFVESNSRASSTHLVYVNRPSECVSTSTIGFEYLTPGKRASKEYVGTPKRRKSMHSILELSMPERDSESHHRRSD